MRFCVASDLEKTCRRSCNRSDRLGGEALRVPSPAPSSACIDQLMETDSSRCQLPRCAVNNNEA